MVILVGLHIGRSIIYQTYDRKYYTLSLSCAKNHPIEGNFKFINKNNNQSTTLDDDYAYWGFASSYDIVYQPTPYTLSAHWVALRERKIYKGNFELPHKKIDSFFALKNSEKAKLKEDEMSSGYGFHFGVGISPGGMITVWIATKTYQKEIAVFKANEYDKYLGNATGEESINILTDDFYSSNRVIDSIIENNIPPELNRWKQYSKRFNYYIQLKSFSQDTTLLEVDFFNEEFDQYKIPDQSKQYVYTSVPKHIRYSIPNQEETKRYKFSDTLISKFTEFKKSLIPNDTIILVLEKNIGRKIKMHLTSVDNLSKKTFQ